MKVVTVGALAAALLGPTCANAACRLTTVEVPVTMAGLRPLVSAKIDGSPVKLLLDSGAFFSALDAKFVAEQKLKAVGRIPTGSHLEADVKRAIVDARGSRRMAGTVTAQFEFGGVTFAGVDFLTVAGVGDASGLLGQNVLHQADDEYDLKNAVMRLVKPEDCASASLAYWLKPGMHYSVAPLESTGRTNLHTISMILVNGVKMRAYFDTGAETSFITTQAAERAGVKTTDPGVRFAGYGHATDGQVKTWVAPFADIKIGDEEIKNTQLAIGDSKADAFDVLIGADFFLAHHVYVANSQGKVYFSYSGGPVFRPPSPDAAANADANPR